MLCSILFYWKCRHNFFTVSSHQTWRRTTYFNRRLSLRDSPQYQQFFKEGPHNHVAGYGVVSVPMFHESRPIIVVNLQTWMIGNWGENEMRLTCRCYNHLSHFLRLLQNHMPVSSFFTLSHPLLGRTHILPLVWWLYSFQDQSIKTTSTKVQLKFPICVTLSVVASYFDLIIRPKRQDFLHRAAPFPDGPSNGEKGVLREARVVLHWSSTDSPSDTADLGMAGATFRLSPITGHNK